MNTNKNDEIQTALADELQLAIAARDAALAELEHARARTDLSSPGQVKSFVDKERAYKKTDEIVAEILTRRASS